MSPAELRITLAGAERVVAAGTTAGEALEADGRTVIAARVNGELRDLAAQVADGDVVEPVDDRPATTGRAIVRHSTAHVMAQAVQELFPEAKLGIGPPIENGFYYDFDVARAVHPRDLKRIEKRMREIVKQGQLFSRRRRLRRARPREELAAEPYKLELIGLKGGAVRTRSSVEVGGGELTIYDNLDAKTGELCWKDLCRGPHLPTTRPIPAFKLMRSGGAYWRGSEKNPQLQRIYGTAWESREQQDDTSSMLEEAAKRDHRKLGAELDLFSFPRRDRLRACRSSTPRAASSAGRWRTTRAGGTRRRATSSSTPRTSPRRRCSRPPATCGWYADGMFPPMEMEGADYYLKPMNCPMHNLIFRARGRSYRELPLRLFEFGTVYRYEKSGVVHGLTRVRGMTQDDAHIYCTREQMRRRAQVAAAASCSTCCATTAWTTSTWSCPPATTRRSSSATRREWEEATEALRAGRRASPAWSWSPTRAARRSTARRSPCRPRTRSAAPGRCPPSRSTSTCRSGSTWSTRRPTAPGSGPS